MMQGGFELELALYVFPNARHMKWLAPKPLRP